jgi:hypothetical protein
MVFFGRRWSLAIVCGVFSLLIAYSLYGTVVTDDNRTLAGFGDHYTKNAPDWFFMDRQIQQGEFPLWNPHTLNGAPFAAHPSSQAFYPPNLIRSYLANVSVPRDTLISLLIMGCFHIFVATLGMYGLSRGLGLAPITSGVISISVAFSLRWVGLIVAWLPVLSTTVWTPLILFLLHNAVKGGGRHRFGWLILAGAFYGWQISAGFPQVAVVATFLYIAFVGGLLAAGSDKDLFTVSYILKGLFNWTGMMALFGLTGLLLAMAFAAPATEFLGLTARSSTNYSQFKSIGANFPSFSVLNLTMDRAGPSLLDKALALGKISNNWLPVNIAILITAVASLWSLNRKFVVLFGILLFLLLDLCFGDPMPVSTYILKYLPFSITHNQYASGLVAIPIAILAGFGLEAVFARSTKGSLKLWMVAVMLVVGVGLIVTLAPAMKVRESWYAGWVTALCVFLICLCFFSKYKWGRLVLILLLFSESALYAKEIYQDKYSRKGIMGLPYRGEANWMNQSPEEGVLKPRTISRSKESHLWSLGYAINGYQPLILSDTLAALSNPEDEGKYNRNVRLSENILASTYLKRLFWLASTYVKGDKPSKVSLFPPTRTVYLAVEEPLPLVRLTEDELPNTSIAVPGTQIDLWSAATKSAVQHGKNVQDILIRSVEFPEGHKALFVELTSEAPLIIKLVMKGKKVAQRSVIGPITIPSTGGAYRTVELPLPDFPEANISLKITQIGKGKSPSVDRVYYVVDLADEAELIEVVELSPDSTTIKVRDLPAPRALVFTDTYYPGWQAFVDGKPAEVLKANGYVKAVLLEAGSHEIQFVFRPSSVVFGLWVSFIGTICLVFIVGWCFWPRRGSQ